MSPSFCPLPANPARLHAEFQDLRHRIEQENDAIWGMWEGTDMREAFRLSAQNLATYLAFRRSDITPLQPDLSALGLSTLGRAEPHVRASLDAVEAALSTLAGTPKSFPATERFTRGPAILAARRDTCFGTDSSSTAKARILVTLPTEAATDPQLIPDMIAAGVNAMRINCAHDGPEIWDQMITRIRAASALSGRYIPVLMDLAGPKLRTAEVFASGKARVQVGDRMDIVHSAPEGKVKYPSVTLSHPTLIARLEPGMTVFIDDGKIGAEVVRIKARGAVLRVTRAGPKGEKIKPEKGFNLPAVEINIPALTKADRAALDVVVGRADLIGYSFVQTPDDIRLLVEEVDKRLPTNASRPALVLKIETNLALRNLPRLIVQAGALTETAVMIARGDLAVEIGLERMSEMQEEILWLCEAAHVPVVWATQVLEGLMKQGLASRAEVTDAAMSARADCVMLNKGPYAVETVKFLSRVLARMDRHVNKKSARLGPLRSWRGDLQL